MRRFLCSPVALTVASAMLFSCENRIDAGEDIETVDAGDAAEDAQPSTPQSCSASVPCPSGYDCLGGLCAASSGVVDCDPDQVITGGDGCGPNAVCVEGGDDQTRCYTLPVCPDDGVCPVGLVGSTCNEGYLLQKNRICLLNTCVDQSSCPAGWNCLRGTGSAVLGNCSDGSFGSLCYRQEDCLSGVCIQGAPSFPGNCL